MGIYALFLLMSLWSLFTVAFSNPGYTLDYFVFKRMEEQNFDEEEAQLEKEGEMHPIYN